MTAVHANGPGGDASPADKQVGLIWINVAAHPVGPERCHVLSAPGSRAGAPGSGVARWNCSGVPYRAACGTCPARSLQRNASAIPSRPVMRPRADQGH